MGQARLVIPEYFVSRTVIQYGKARDGLPKLSDRFTYSLVVNRECLPPSGVCNLLLMFLSLFPVKRLDDNVVHALTGPCRCLAQETLGFGILDQQRHVPILRRLFAMPHCATM